MAINRAQLVKELEPGLNGIFFSEVMGYDQEHLALFEVENSIRAFEEEVLFTGFGAAPVKPEGTAVQYDEAREGWVARYNHENIALAFSITEEAMDDNLYDTVSRRLTKALARSMAHTKQVKGANVFNRGFNNAYLGGDGVELFSDSHVMIDNSTQSNKPTTDVDLSEVALEDALITISLIDDDRGIPMGLQARKLCIPPQLQFVVERLLMSPLRPDTANNDINAMYSMGMFPDGWGINHRFTDTDAWFIKTDAKDGTKMFVRKSLKTKMEADFETGNVRYKAGERYSFGWSDWRGWYASSGN